MLKQQCITISHYYLMLLKVNFVFWTLFNTKCIELYFSFFSCSTYQDMLMVKIARCFEVFCIPIWNKWIFGIIWKMIFRGSSSPQPPLQMRAFSEAGGGCEPPLKISFVEAAHPPPVPKNRTHFQGRLRGEPPLQIPYLGVAHFYYTHAPFIGMSDFLVRL